MIRIKGKRIRSGIGILALALVTIHCSGPTETVIVNEKSLTVKLVPDQKEPIYDHPKEITVQAMAKILDSLFYTQFELFHWGDKEPVFGQGAIHRAAAAIVEALQRAGGTELVQFTVVERFKQLIFAHDVVTTADVYSKGDEIHFIFLQLRDEFLPDGGGHEGSTFSPGRDWKLAPGPGQRLMARKKTFTGRRVSDKQWLVVDLQELDRLEGRGAVAVEPPVRDEEAEEGRVEAAPPMEPAEEEPLAEAIMEKLRALKEMREEGLITEEEYRKKKAELLAEM